MRNRKYVNNTTVIATSWLKVGVMVLKKPMSMLFHNIARKNTDTLTKNTNIVTNAAVEMEKRSDVRI